ncbi:monocarboxylate transporter 2-like [Gigantopelta aegis]|uniref:monocarboxylate transporter 2-like n=1 Tax=Gigantopelta aegis TaxID=1735272 RepID=UPI001B88D794|nr:monocarboxylate transporter 2-like [Gigantopelta aegis]
MAINVAFNNHNDCEVTCNGVRDETTDDSRIQTTALRTALSDTASDDTVLPTTALGIATSDTASKVTVLATTVLRSTSSDTASVVAVLATTALSNCDRSKNKDVRTDQQTEDVDGPWSTKSSKRLPINGTCVVQNVIPDKEITRRRWYLKPRLRKQIVLVGLSFMTLVVSYGYVMSLAVLFLPIKDTFGTNTAETALLRSVCLGSLLCAGAVVSPLFLKYGAGPVGFVGSLVATTGLVVSFLTPSFPLLVVSGGFTTGIGLCCQYVINFSVVGTVIKSSKWRDFAFALLASAGGIGFSVSPVMTAFLLERFAWRGAMLLLGGITLQCCPAFLAIDAIARDLIQKDRKLDETVVSKSNWNLSLFKEFGFLAIGFNVFVIMALIPTVNYFLVDMSKSKGFDVNTGAFFLTLAGMSGLAGRLLCVALTALKKGSKILLIAFLYILTGAFMAIMPFAQTYPFMATVIPLYNIPFGAESVLFPSTVYEVAGIHRYTSAMGYTGLIGGVATWISGPIGGMIKDLSGSYDGVVYMGVFGCASCAICFFILYVYRRRSAKQNVEVENEEVDTYL